MKKTFLITSIILAFCCFSCNDELLDSNIVVQDPTNNSGGNNGGGNGNGGGNNGGNSTTTLSAYSLDSTSNVPIFGEITINSDFIISNNVVLSANVETVAFGTSVNGVSTITRDNNGKIVQVETTSGTTVSNRTTITYSGDNISQIMYEDLEDATENYTYTFAYSGTTVTRTNAPADESAVFTFNSNSQLISKESFSGTNSTQLETLTYSGGNCISSTVSGSNPGNNTFSYDAFTNPLQTVFNDQYLLSIFESENNEQVATLIATLHGTNNWTGIQTNQGNVDFTITYDANNKITARDSSFDLGDGVVISQSEVFTYQ